MALLRYELYIRKDFIVKTVADINFEPQKRDSGYRESVLIRASNHL